MTRQRASAGCAVAALAAYGGALASVIHGYPHALDNACPDGSPAPAAFWPLLAVAVAFAVAAFMLRRKDPKDLVAIFVVVTVPLAAVVTIFGYAVAYACWE